MVIYIWSYWPLQRGADLILCAGMFGVRYMFREMWGFLGITMYAVDVLRGRHAALSLHALKKPAPPFGEVCSASRHRLGGAEQPMAWRVSLSPS